ncbi:NAD(+)/NADH kinase [Microbacterium sp. Re1]|uniref:NAD(+)/NADH kinase n=1 Tax=Microbacterium commune TaxID=2762219 RepID=A0ABR8W1W4_9MICO|nr:diacylglycerol kinase family protein [Microbacterium commune]MBD8011018.1 NAD(+)/NADH kinase [Microbacterium commune]
MNEAHSPAPHAAVVYHPLKVPVRRLRAVVAEHEAANGWARTRWHETAGDDSGRAAAESALAHRPAVVLVAGGDGTVRAVAEVMQATGIPIALIPLGTGNLLARDIGAPLNDLAACVRAAFSGVDRAVDVGMAELDDEGGSRRTTAFMVMAGIGLDAEMAESTSANAKKRLGWFAYVAPIARSVIANRLFHLDYRIDGGRTRSTRAHTVIVGNCGTLTGNMLLIPAAIIDDGLLDVVMMRPAGRFGWARIGTRLTLQGLARRSPLGRRLLQQTPDLHSLAYLRGRRFEARFDAPHLVELDGDGFGHVTRVRITVRPGALVVRTPAHRGAPSAGAAPGGRARAPRE